MCGRDVQVMCLCTCVMGEACVDVWEVICLCTCVMGEVCTCVGGVCK